MKRRTTAPAVATMRLPISPPPSETPKVLNRKPPEECANDADYEVPPCPPAPTWVRTSPLRARLTARIPRRDRSALDVDFPDEVADRYREEEPHQRLLFEKGLDEIHCRASFWSDGTKDAPNTQPRRQPRQGDDQANEQREAPHPRKRSVSSIESSM